MCLFPVIYGRLTAEDYTDKIAADPRIDELRSKIACEEDKTFSAEYHDPEKRFIGNALTITLNDGTVLDEVHIDYPVGHKRRRAGGTPLLEAKVRWKFDLHAIRNIRALTMRRLFIQFKRHIEPHYPADHVEK